jgi:hypothetical protein
MEDQPISKVQLGVIEKSLDRLFAKLNIDVVFTKHFFDRINDARNGQQITPKELVGIYNDLYAKYGVQIAEDGMSDDDISELIKSLSTDINIPIELGYDKRNKKVLLIAATVMRKKNFKSNSNEPVLTVENNIMSFEEFKKANLI